MNPIMSLLSSQLGNTNGSDLIKQIGGIAVLGTMVAGSCFLLRSSFNTKKSIQIEGLTDEENNIIGTNMDIVILLERLDRYKYLININRLNKIVYEIISLLLISENTFDYKISYHASSLYTSLEHECRVLHNLLETKLQDTNTLQIKEFEDILSELDDLCKNITFNIKMNESYLLSLKKY